MNRDPDPQYITDEHGSRVSVVLPINKWEHIMDKLKELDDIQLYNEAQARAEITKPLSQSPSGNQQTRYSVSEDDERSKDTSEPKEWYNCSEILLFTSKGNVYTVENQGYKSEKRLKDSAGFERGERCIAIIGIPYIDEANRYLYNLIFGFRNGCVAKIYTNSFLGHRRKQSNVFYGEACVFVMQISDDTDFLVVSSTKKALVFDSSLLRSIESRKSYGVQIMKLKKNTYLDIIKELSEVSIHDISYYRRTSLPAFGYELKDVDDLNFNSDY